MQAGQLELLVPLPLGYLNMYWCSYCLGGQVGRCRNLKIHWTHGIQVIQRYQHIEFISENHWDWHTIDVIWSQQEALINMNNWIFYQWQKRDHFFLEWSIAVWCSRLSDRLVFRKTKFKSLLIHWNSLWEWNWETQSLVISLTLNALLGLL